MRHRDAVLERVPRLLNRTFTLDEAAQIAKCGRAANISDMGGLRAEILADEARDVPDPINQDFHVFESVGSRIAGLLRPVVELCRRSVVE